MPGKDRSVDVHGMKRGWVAVVAIGVLVLTVGLQGQVPEGGSGYSAADWPFVGGNWSSSRYSTLSDITTETVDRLFPGVEIGRHL